MAELEYYTFDAPEFNKEFHTEPIGKLNFSDDAWKMFETKNPNIVNTKEFVDDYESFADDYIFPNDCNQAIEFKKKMFDYIKTNEQLYKKELEKEFIDKAQLTELKSRLNRTKELIVLKMPDTCDVYSAQIKWGDGKFSRYEFYENRNMTEEERAELECRFTEHTRNSPFYTDNHHPWRVFTIAFVGIAVCISVLAGSGILGSVLVGVFLFIPLLIVATLITIGYESLYAKLFGVDVDKKQVGEIVAFSAAAGTAHIIAGKHKHRDHLHETINSMNKEI